MANAESQLLREQPKEKRRGCFNFSNLNPEPHELPMPDLTDREERIHTQLQWIQYLMDGAVTLPCTGGRTLGLDPVVGLVPFVGDFAGAVVSCVLVARASRVVSKYTVTRMLTNVAIDATVGTIPLLGDLFDVGWQANTRNLTMYENHMKLGAERQRDLDKTYVWSTVCLLVTIVFFTMLVWTAAFVLLILWLTGNLG